MTHCCMIKTSGHPHLAARQLLLAVALCLAAGVAGAMNRLVYPLTSADDIDSRYSRHRKMTHP